MAEISVKLLSGGTRDIEVAIDDDEAKEEAVIGVVVFGFLRICGDNR